MASPKVGSTSKESCQPTGSCLTKFEGAGKPHWVPTNFGDALRIKMRWGMGTLARKATLGWVFDANDHLVTRRVDFARYVTGTISPSPGLATDDADLLVQAVTRAVDEAEWAPGEGRIPDSDISYAHSPPRCGGGMVAARTRLSRR